MKPAIIVGDQRHAHNIKLERLIREGKIKTQIGLNDLDIHHDHWCRLLTEDGFCNCDPEIIFNGEKLE